MNRSNRFSLLKKWRNISFASSDIDCFVSKYPNKTYSQPRHLISKKKFIKFYCLGFWFCSIFGLLIGQNSFIVGKCCHDSFIVLLCSHFVFSNLPRIPKLICWNSVFYSFSYFCIFFCPHCGLMAFVYLL